MPASAPQQPAAALPTGTAQGPAANDRDVMPGAAVANAPQPGWDPYEVWRLRVLQPVR